LSAKQRERWRQLHVLTAEDFDRLATAAPGEWPTFKAALKLAKQRAAGDKPEPRLRLVTEDAPDCFTTVVIDPPWRYENVATRGAAEDHYPTMSLTELDGLDVPAADDAHLYLWATNAFLAHAFNLVTTWGFTYKTTLTWCKPSIGMGNYYRNNTEHVLFAVKGRLPTNRNDVGTWFLADRKRHSAKPEVFYDLVESCSPGPYLEMFARRRRLGWHVWGNEA
jgi:N6-adenosine-specific RNA methylase IME4